MDGQMVLLPQGARGQRLGGLIVLDDRNGYGGAFPDARPLVGLLEVVVRGAVPPLMLARRF